MIGGTRKCESPRPFPWESKGHDPTFPVSVGASLPCTPNAVGHCSLVSRRGLAACQANIGLDANSRVADRMKTHPGFLAGCGCAGKREVVFREIYSCRYKVSRSNPANLAYPSSGNSQRNALCLGRISSRTLVGLTELLTVGYCKKSTHEPSALDRPKNTSVEGQRPLCGASEVSVVTERQLAISRVEHLVDIRSEGPASPGRSTICSGAGWRPIWRSNPTNLVKLPLCTRVTRVRPAKLSCARPIGTTTRSRKRPTMLGSPLSPVVSGYSR